jgi:DNA polymerase
VICEVDDDIQLNDILAAMAAPIDWAPGLPLKGAGFCADYYQKD